MKAAAMMNRAHMPVLRCWFGNAGRFELARSRALGTGMNAIDSIGCPAKFGRKLHTTSTLVPAM